MASYSRPIRRRKNGRESVTYWVRINQGGRRTWRSTQKRTLKLAKEVLETWRMRDAKGERYVEDASLLWRSAKLTRLRSDKVSHRFAAGDAR